MSIQQMKIHKNYPFVQLYGLWHAFVSSKIAEDNIVWESKQEHFQSVKINIGGSISVILLHQKDYFCTF